MPDGFDAGGSTTVLGVRSSLCGRRWAWAEGDARIGLGLAQRLGAPEIVGRLLAARGVGADDAADFLRPTVRALLPDPSRLADMGAATDRLSRAVMRGETVGILGDYDVDGACATAVLATVLGRLGCATPIHIPDRMTEGYGPNPAALAGLVSRAATLIVCVDCGTAARDALASLAGAAEMIVLDHHKAEGPPPRAALATVNPNRLDCGSGLGHLCAAGIVFLVCVSLLRGLRRAGFFADRAEPSLLALLDLVALATVCDVMPLRGINRAFVVQGLKVMAAGERPGIAALLEVAGARTLDAATLGFALGPRINAGGRIDDASAGTRLLLAQDEAEARALASRLDGVNRQRQAVEAGVLDAALMAAEAQLDAGHATICVAGECWHRGIVGIVAGRLRERFNRPACVAEIEGGVARGSGRSVSGLDLGAAVIAARQAGLLTGGGGHAMAAGFALPTAGLDAFHAWLDVRLAAAVALPRAEALRIEGTLTPEAVTPDLVAHVASLAPFGAGNPEPVFVVARARVVRADRVGADGAVGRAFVTGEGGGRLKAMLFRARRPALMEALLERGGRPLHLAGTIRAETWCGRTEAYLCVEDAAFAVS